MTRLYIMCGLAFSGKSTLSRKISEHSNCKIVAFDQLWVETEKNRSVPQSAEGWRLIRDLAQDQIFATLKSGTSVVYDDNNPKKEHREELRRVADKAGVESSVIYLDTPLDVIRMREKNNRLSQDRHEVEPENFEKVLQDLEPPTSEENVYVFGPTDSLDDFIKTLPN
jgi:predicted kinase